MSTEKLTKSKVAVIGLGNIGQVVAANLVKSNRPVIIANRNSAKATELSAKLGNLAKAMDIAAAIKKADIVVFMPFMRSKNDQIIKTG